MMKAKKSSKFLAMLLTLAMVLSMTSISAVAADVPRTSTDAVDGLTISVDYSTELVYLEKVSNTEYNVRCGATNGYYPFSFSVIMNNRSLVAGRPTVSNGGAFSWAYDEETKQESTTTPYGLATLPVGSSSTIVVTTASGTQITLNCSAPNGGTTAAGAEIYAFLPAPGQFTNEGVTVGGWGDAYDNNGNLKANSATGMSLGFFGGYVVYKFDNPVANNPSNPYGVDFIVYGNAFWGNSEPGCIQVSQDGSTWYDIAGSRYYDSDTIKNYSLTYQNPNITEDAGITTAASNQGSLAAVTYTGSDSGTITTNTFHNHSWFPLNANYFSARNGDAALDKISELSFANRTVSNGVTDTLTLSGVKLSDVSTGDTAGYGFGYCDVHPNNALGGSTAYNPYQTFTSSSDYNSKTSGTSGGDPIDISWAVDANGQPVNLSSIQYVRIYTGAAQMNGIFGEISTEVCGIAAATGTGSTNITEDLYIVDEATGENEVNTSNGGSQTVSAGEYILYSDVERVLLNGETIDDAADGHVFTMAAGDMLQIITQTGEEAPYITVLICK